MNVSVFPSCSDPAIFPHRNQSGAFDVYGLPDERCCADIEERIAGAVANPVAQMMVETRFRMPYNQHRQLNIHSSENPSDGSCSPKGERMFCPLCHADSM